MDKTRQGLNVAFGLLCMSTTWQEPLLWSHYADKHKGMCLGFDVDDTHWEPARYRAARPSLNYYGVSDWGRFKRNSNHAVVRNVIPIAHA
ncbi:DUF2971 domain-containing protein [Rhizobium leguminosarum bv. viciae]|nr:DUF2971 domain-containing protein [Rhizobium leguminosarum bv. viciae]